MVSCRKWQWGGILRLAGLALALAALAGCGHKAAYQPPPPPTLPPETTPQTGQAQPVPPPAPAPETETTNGVSAADLEFIESHKPVLSEVGMATWYRDYRGRKQADGDPLDDDAMTAANRTLPLGSLVVVTNLKTGQSGAMHITDRGPFIAGRIVDLSIASAKAVGIYRDGIDKVRMDVYQTPKPIWSGGRWCVQIGAFSSERRAEAFKKKLMQKYPRASVIDFAAEKHEYWVRIRPHDDDRALSEYLARHLRPSEGVAFLTRLD
ncbi:MAG TPA: septal ring lytic transglycosylase RlpA family protein [Terracidiphilus sp.]